MEYKVCNNCKKRKPVNLFYLLNNRKKWRRSSCIKCTNAANKRNRKKRKKIAGLLILLLLSFTLQAQQMSHDQIRSSLFDELNEARSNPYSFAESIDLKIGRGYKSRHALKYDKKLQAVAQARAEEQSKYGNLSHEIRIPNKKYLKLDYFEECLSMAGNVNGQIDKYFLQTVKQYIIDEGVDDVGHRKALLGKGKSKHNKKVGIGLFRDGDNIYTCFLFL